MEDKVCESWITLDDGTELHCDRHPAMSRRTVATNPATEEPNPNV